MKGILSNNFLLLLSRCVIGFVFIYASLNKLNDPMTLAQLIDNYKILPEQLSVIVAMVLPWLELLCGVCLLVGFFLKGSSLTITLLLVIFILSVASALLRSLDISCGCFTLDPSAQRIGWMKVFEDIGLLILSVYILFSTGEFFSLDKYLHQKEYLK